MPDIAHCPRCEGEQKYDLRGSCRTCGTKIAPNAPPPPVKLDIPRTWGELWPTVLFSGILAAGGLGLIGGGVFAFQHFPTDNEKTGSVLCLFGVGLLVCAAKCWIK